MNGRAVFYLLTHKFVNDQESIPDDARQVIYYSLAIGHHVGVMDCFKSFMEISLEDYQKWVNRLPEGSGRHKLEGLLKWGEIEIHNTHAGELLPVLRNELSQMEACEAQWTGLFIEYIQKMVDEPALYVMVRKRP